MIAHTYGYPDNLRALAPAKQRKQQILPEKATGNMYLTDPRPWGNSKGGERSFTRRCKRQVRGGGPFIGEGGSPRGHGRRPRRVPPPLPHSCGGSSTHIKTSPLTIPLTCINFPPKLMQALI